MKSWVIYVDGFPPTFRDAETRGKAHAWAFKALCACGYGYEWKDIKVRRCPSGDFGNVADAGGKE